MRRADSLFSYTCAVAFILYHAVVEYWVHSRYKERAARSFRNTIRMLDFFSDKIGVEYPWDRYAQICCEGFGGGMENTAATTLGNRALHDARSFLDSNADGLIAHELAHQWWGDLLTCRDWAHLWLNEGFASYAEALWVEHDRGRDEFAYNMYRKGRSARRGGTKRPIVDRAYDQVEARATPATQEEKNSPRRTRRTRRRSQEVGCLGVSSR